MKPIVYNKYIVICQVFEETRHPKPLIAEDGSQVIQEPYVLTILVPRVIIPRNRSKYMPHQGKREKARRLSQKA